MFVIGKYAFVVNYSYQAAELGFKLRTSVYKLMLTGRNKGKRLPLADGVRGVGI